METNWQTAYFYTDNPSTLPRKYLARMNVTAIKRFREKLARDELTLGLWVTLESPSITEAAVAIGIDWITIDAEHGHLGWNDIVHHVRAAVRSETPVVVRIAELNGGLIKRVLDIGADGVIIPWMESASQLREAVSWATYPPVGKRGMGGERATCWGQALTQHVDECRDYPPLVIPLIESVEGYQHVDEMLGVEGVDVFFFGPADFSATAGYPGQWEGPGVAEMILDAKNKIRTAGKHCGVMATSNENLCQRREQGFRMIGTGMDIGLMIRSLRDSLAEDGRGGELNTSFIPPQK